MYGCDQYTEWIGKHKHIYKHILEFKILCLKYKLTILTQFAHMDWLSVKVPKPADSIYLWIWYNHNLI